MSSKLILICEDLQLECFIRRFLLQRGWERRQIRSLIAPSGKGSGEQWVRENYPKELSAMRDKDGVSLIIGTDADILTIADRIKSLDKYCEENKTPPRSYDEPVVMVVPKRNIETWLAYLRGDDVNEDSNYPRDRAASNCRDAVRNLARMCDKQTLRQPVPPSLDAACVEYRRLK